MKHSFQIHTIFLFLFLSSGCQTQYIMRTLSDAQKIKTNEKKFVGKPLINLLKEIKPKIEMVTANPSPNNRVRLGYFIFRFEDRNTYDSIRTQGKYPLGITVFVKEPFRWDIHERPKGDEFRWTKDDIKRLGNLTIVGITVFKRD